MLENSRNLRPSLSKRGLILSFLVPLLIVAVFFALSSEFFHWFLLPVYACGVLIFSEFFRWNSRQLMVFHPAGLISIVGVFFFFMNPLLHVYWGSWMKYVMPPPDWRPWLGGMAILNALGLLAYISTFGFFQKLIKRRLQKNRWTIDRRRFLFLLVIGMAVSLFLQLGIFQQFGGLSGYINSYKDGTAAFTGMGLMFVFSESLPILLFAFIITLTGGRGVLKKPFMLIGLTGFILFLQFLFGGLRGSRGNTLYLAFWLAGIIHYHIRPIRGKKILVGGLAAFSFIYIYGFYKSLGADAFLMLSERGIKEISILEDRSGRDWRSTLLGDFGRSDVQAYLVYRTWDFPGEYRYGWGRIYLEDLSFLVPLSVWADRPLGKILWGTDLLRGYGAWSPKPGGQALNAYGLAGEAVLNFGPYSVPFTFIFLGFAVAMIGGSLLNIDRSLIRILCVPLLIEACLWLLLWDFGNIVYFLIQHLGFLGIILFLSLRRVRRKEVKIPKVQVTQAG